MRGERARLPSVALQQAQKRSGQAISKAQVVGADDAVIIGVIGVLGIAVIAAVVAGLGQFALYDVLMEAMKRGYALHYPKFRMAAVGYSRRRSKDSWRQSHSLVQVGGLSADLVAAKTWIDRTSIVRPAPRNPRATALENDRV